MKKLMKTMILAVLMMSVCACGNGSREGNSQTDEPAPWRPSYSYSAIVIEKARGPRELIGLAIKESSEYCYFNDDVNYNSEIFEWADYYWIASALFKAGVTDPAELDAILASIPNLPNFNNITNQKYAEIVRREYYNNQDINYYEPNRKYGSHNYPTDKRGSFDFGSYDRYLSIKRFNGTKEGKVIGSFPSNVLAIVEYHTNSHFIGE